MRSWCILGSQIKSAASWGGVVALYGQGRWGKKEEEEEEEEESVAAAHSGLKLYEIDAFIS